MIFTAVCGFVAFLHLPSSMGKFGKVINFVSPSLFSIYVLHECCLNQYQYLQGGTYLYYMLYATEYFKAVHHREKTFELRKDDSDYQVGDMLRLREWDGEKYTGNITFKRWAKSFCARACGWIKSCAY